MKLHWIIAGTLLMLSPAWGASAQEENEEESEDRQTIIIKIDDEDEGFSFDLSELGEMIETVMKAIGEALEGTSESLHDAIRSSGDAFHVGHLAKSEAGDYTTIDVTKSTGDSPDIEIYNLAGSVRIVGWDKNEIHVEGTLGEDVEELEFDVTSSSADIRVKIPRGRARKVKSELTFHVPVGSSVEIETVSASIDVAGLKGDSLEFETVSGEIEVKDSSGDVEANSTSGSILIEGEYEDIEAETISGSVTIAGRSKSVEAQSISGSVKIEGVRRRLEAESVSGSITISAEMLEDLDVESVSGSVRIEGMPAEDGEFEINTLSGSVRIEFLGEVSGEFDIETFSGRIQCAFGPEPEKEKFGPGKSLRFTQGDGDARITVETFSGSITIRVQ